MSRIFISHSAANNAEAIALRDWLAANGWDDLFLDVDPTRGLKAGDRWQAALKNAAERCELVIFLLSPFWTQSKWCVTEFLLAKSLNKRIIGVIVEPTPLDELPTEMTSEWQIADLTRGARDYVARVSPPGAPPADVAFSSDELNRLKIGLLEAGLDARFFAWPPPHDPNRSPYPGLRPLEFEDAGIFFGRDGPVVLGLEMLRGLREQPAPGLLVVLGASGAGKSSFMRAGLLPRLTREDRHFLPLPVVRPDRAVLTGASGLIAGLERAMKEAGSARTRATIRSAVSAGYEAVLPLLGELQDLAARRAVSATPKPITLVLPVDQAEELFIAEGAEEATEFMALLAGLLEQKTLAMIALFTIRSDNYEQLQTAPSLQGVRQHTLSLPPLPRGSYADVIKGPARRLEGTKRPLELQGDLVDALLTDIEASVAKDALPLLAFTLERLYREHGGDGKLTVSDYRQLGGFEGSIEAAVEQAFKSADSDPRVPRDRAARSALLRRGLIPWLAGIDPDTGLPRRRVARLSEIPPEARPLVDHLVEQRLLSTDVSASTGEKTIEPAHESLLRRWGLLNSWLAEDHVLLSIMDGVKRASRDWAANAKAKTWLTHRAERLVAAERLVERPDLSASLDATDLEYLALSREAEDLAARTRRRGKILVGCLAACIVVGLIAWKNQDFLRKEIVWYFVAKPYMASNFQPYVLKPEAELALKPSDAFRECAKNCPEMIVVPKGQFLMGSPESEVNHHPDEGPQAVVAISQSFAVSKAPVTFDDWDACVTTGGCVATSASGFGRGQKPAINLTWDDAIAYATWLSEMTGKTYRLLSEAEWEYAARAGTETPFWFGASDKADQFTWYGKNSEARPHDVGQKPANAFGLYDMTGQVWQWVSDCYYESYQPRSPGEAAACKENRRVARGGSWDSTPEYIRSAQRGWYASDRRSQFLGFRIARTLKQ